MKIRNQREINYMIQLALTKSSSKDVVTTIC